jgi:phosphoribosylaminoimidazole (AIR) synthetase
VAKLFTKLAGVTTASYLWFEYLLLTEENTQKYLSKRGKKILFLPVLVLIAAGIPSQWTHWRGFCNITGCGLKQNIMKNRKEAYRIKITDERR